MPYFTAYESKIAVSAHAKIIECASLRRIFLQLSAAKELNNFQNENY